MSVASMSFAPENSPGRPRPTLIRRDTDQILSYYQSEDAGKTYYADDYVLKLAPSASSASTATTTTVTTNTTDSRSSSPSSTYSDSEPSDHDEGPKNVTAPVVVVAPSISQRRTSKGSSGGSDKRRVAIVEMDAERHEDNSNGSNRHGAGSSGTRNHAGLGRSSPNGTSDLLSRRGRGNLAFVAPPDASPSLYAELTPPCQSAPVVPQQQHQQLEHPPQPGRENNGRSSSGRSSKGGHHRSQSDAIEPRRLRMRKTSRDIGIVGTSITLSPTQVQKMDLSSDNHHHHDTAAVDHSQPQISPVFQTPHDDHGQKTDPLLEKAEALMQEARVGRERGRERERESHQQKSSANGHPSSSSSNSNTNKRDSAISPVIVGISPDQMWQALPPVSPPTVISYTPIPAVAVPVQLASPAVAASFVAAPPYLYYQPGVHATAGPLPPPPRQMNGNGAAPSASSPPRKLSPSGSMSPPPPRPPRLHTPSTSERLSQRLSPASSTRTLEKERSLSSERPSRSPKAQSSSVEDHSTTGHADRQGSSSKSNHTREGAFVTSPAISDSVPDAAQIVEPPPKRSSPSRDLDLVRNNSSSSGASRIRKASSELALRHDTPPVPDHPSENSSERNPSLPKRRSGFDLRKQISKSTLKSSSSASPLKVSKPLPEPSLPATPASPFTPPSDSGHSFMSPASFEAKRFSRLPKTPSGLSAANSSNPSDHSGGRLSPRQRRTTTKVKSAYPEAMYFGEISSMRKASERSIAYATKINELANHDAGLEDWVKAMKRQYTKSRTSTDDGPLMSPTGPRGPSSSPFVVQTRHPSRGSIGSEVTFPRRLDGYVATDLTPSEDDVIPEGPPPSLPYPSLAQGARVPPSRTFGGSSAASLAPSSLHRAPSTQSSAKSTTGGFFASLGRKSSMKREKSIASSSLMSAATSSPIANKLLMRRNPTLPPPAPRPVQIVATPSLPGGPRAPPNRIQRTQSVMIAPAKTPAPSVSPSSRLERHMSHRSSSTRSASISTSLNHSTALREGSPEFEKQARKLCDLMPNADPHILRGYLLRAGQDMVAIGQYLEDERKGCLRRD